MEELLKFFNNNKDAITGLGIVLTFTASMLTLYLSKRNNKALHYVNSITKNRVEWIYKLREYIAEYVALTAIDKHTLLIHGEEKLSQHFETVRLKKTNIELLLNYTGDLDSKIIGIIEELESKSTKFYGTLKLFEQIMEEDLTDAEKDKLVADDVFVRDYVVDYMNSQGFKYSQNIYGLCFAISLLVDIKKLRNEEKLASWDGGLALNCKNLVNDIEKLTVELVEIVQVYLKFEWNRVKYEGEGKEYYKKLQQFDMNELLELRKNPEYKVKSVKRYFVNIGLVIWSKRYWIILIISIVLLLISFFRIIK